MAHTQKQDGGPLPVVDAIIPKLNLLQWDQFQAAPWQAQAFAIDVLVEDGPIQDTAAVPGRAPLPERIRVNSETIIRSLGKLQQSKIVWKSEPVILLRPFRILRLHDSEIRSRPGEMACLVEFMDIYLEPKLSYLQGPNLSTVLFSDLWLLFNPDDLVLHRDKDQAYRVVSVTSTETAVHIECVYIDFNGRELGPVACLFTVPQFDGHRRISALDVWPLRLVPDYQGTVDRMEKRGRKFTQAIKIAPMHYCGSTLDSDLEVDSTVVIDFLEAFRDDGRIEWRPDVRSLLESDQIIQKARDTPSKPGLSHDDAYVETARRNSLIRHYLLPSHNWPNPHPTVRALKMKDLVAATDLGELPDEEAIIMSPRVFGFIFATKKWAQLAVSNLTPIAFDGGRGFDRLVLPQGTKQMASRLVQQHFARKLGTSRKYPGMDRKKGTGINLLLHGQPGTGKKTTAECVASLVGRPLLRIAAGDVGQEVETATKNLYRYFTLADRWDCIILVQDTDYFLSQRARHDTSTFLRLIDSHGVAVFLTTSRVGLLDDEAKSSLHAMLYYPPLDQNATIRIFELNAQRLLSDDPDISIQQVEIKDFAVALWDQRPESRWNGRQIRNAFDTALKLAQSDANPRRGSRGSVRLKASHFELVARTGEKFDKYLRAVTGATDSEMALERRERLDTWTAPKERPSGQSDPPLRIPPPRQVTTLQPMLQPTFQSALQPPLPWQQHVQQFPGHAGTSAFTPAGKYQQAVEHNLPTGQYEPPEYQSGNQPEAALAYPTNSILTSVVSVQVKPEVEPMRWEAFVAGRTRRADPRSAIDLLVGDPVVEVNMDDLASMWWSKWANYDDHSNSKVEEHATASIPQSQAQMASITGRAPLPERIRINSKYIMEILEEILDRSLTPRNGTLVMIRPFRTLAYYEDRLRQHLTELEHQLGQDGCATSVDGADSVGTSSVADKVEDEGDDEVEGAYEDEDENGEVAIRASASFKHLQCLVEFIDTNIRYKMQYLKSEHCRRIAFTDLWYLFKPGQVVIGRERRQAYRILSISSSGHKAVAPWQRWELRRSPDSSKLPSITLHCVYVDFDGKRLGPVTTKVKIFRFDEEKEVTSLEVYPLSFAEARNAADSSGASKPSIRDELVARGRTFVYVAGIKAMHYNGTTLDTREEVNSQVVIDFEEAFATKENGYQAPVVEELIGTSIGQVEHEEPCSFACCAGENILQDAEAEKKRNQDYISTLIPDPSDRTKVPSVAIEPRSLPSAGVLENGLHEEDLMIMSYRVFGFVLRSRKWAQLDLRYITPLGSSGNGGEIPGTKAGAGNENGINKKKRPDEARSDQSEKMPVNRQREPKENAVAEEKTQEAIEKRETAFDQLVLPEGHREIILSLIAQHFQDKTSKNAENEETDIVRGKGKGLIILLHGAPGVGKTTTAEGVAQVFNRPLFQMTCGDLGTTATEVETALQRHFTLASRWGCVLLLDEADVFLAERSPQDFTRNSLVAVFLRVLEYYTGILFLTTNRIGDFDEAFSSRIHISLYYPPLRLKSTKKIFRLNLRLIRERIERRGLEILIDRRGILDFAEGYWTEHKKMRWNGRQIRNACQTALALAEYDAQRGGVDRDRHLHGHDAVAEVQGNVDAQAKVRLGVSYFKIVSTAYLQFMSYLKSVYGKDPERRAKEMHLRAREFGPLAWSMGNILDAAEEAEGEDKEGGNTDDEDDENDRDKTEQEDWDRDHREIQDNDEDDDNEEDEDNGDDQEKNQTATSSTTAATSFQQVPQPHGMANFPLFPPQQAGGFANPAQSQADQQQVYQQQRQAWEQQQRQLMINYAAMQNAFAGVPQGQFPNMMGMGMGMGMGMPGGGTSSSHAPSPSIPVSATGGAPSAVAGSSSKPASNGKRLNKKTKK